MVRDEGRARSQQETDEILEVALRLEAQTNERPGLTLADLKRIGVEIGLAEEHIDRAATLVAERQKEHMARQARRRRLLAIAGAVAALGGVGAGAGLLSSRAHLLDELSQAEDRKAQVSNVRLRQQHVEARLKNAPPGPDRDAELSGSENRVAIESRRYDQAVGKYNRTVQTLWGQGARVLFGLPDRLPYSQELPQ